MNVNRKIANNAFYLYLRMSFLMCVSFYTSRIVLEVLGVEDFGIYNVVGGLVILLSFLNNTLITTSQRFLSYEMGVNNGDIRNCFSACLLIIIFFSFVVVLICETIGLWYVNNEMVVPETKLEITKIVFHISVFSIFFSMLRTPFVSLTISHENMPSFAIISIFESLLKLIFVLLLKYFPISNGLVFYTLSICFISFLITVIYVFYCKQKYSSICNLTRKVDRGRISDISKFASWNILSMLSDIGVPQGINLLINGFGGVVLNAAMGIANQVTNAVYSLVSGFQMAFRPQVVKLYSAKRHEELNNLINTASKISLFLMLYLAIPFLIRTKEFMNIWLKEYPISAIPFSRIMVLVFVIEALCGPLWMTIQATGKIKVYQILTISLSISSLFMSYFLLKMEFPIVVILYNRIVLSLLLLNLQFLYLRKLFNFSSMKYCKNLLLNSFIGLISYILIYYICNHFVLFQYLTTTFLLSTLIITLVIFILGMNSQEKRHINSYIKQLLFRN